ncbi:MAG: DUF4140 domain-containing protein, partial [Candidatus Lokiarchaeota archaeon]|nr:DUF4140 domain-containing protein [Candidatus Lokiarchaeota archaeon]
MKKMKAVNLKIKQVILQPDNAIIRREGKISLVKGLNNIEVSSLDPKLDEKTLKLIISGEDIVIHNMKFWTKTIDKQEEVNAIKAEISKKEDEITAKSLKHNDNVFWIGQYKKSQNLLAKRFPGGYCKSAVSIKVYTDFDNHIV